MASLQKNNKNIMKKLIRDFTQHIKQSIEISESTTLHPSKTNINNVLICGLGGSGIGGTIINEIISSNANTPVTINKNYTIPAFVNENTLVIICSYSGNTEETLEMLEKAQAKNAEIACITSGGTVEETAKQNNYNYIKVPGGNPPRAAFGLTFPPLFFLLRNYKITSENYIEQLLVAAELIDIEEESIFEQAFEVSLKLIDKTPIIYASAGFEGVATRFRQQLNENSKMLCWHNIIPEMNHNELVGWTTKKEDFAVVMLRNDNDYYRTQKRMDVNKHIISEYTDITEIYSKGETQLEQALYLIHLTDWISFIIADKKNIDVVEVNVIDHLKSELAKI